jgi:hypothetical protein
VHALGDGFVEHGDVRDQWRAARIDPESVAADVERWLCGLGFRAAPGSGRAIGLAHAS